MSNAARTAWTCPTCHACNVGKTCGCGPRAADNTMDRLNAIELELPVRKSRKGGK